MLSCVRRVRSHSHPGSSQGNRTTDQALNNLPTAEEYIVVTKDTDFVESFLLTGKPWKLLLVSTGNIGNDELINLFDLNIERVAEAFSTLDFIELNRTNVIYYL